MEWYFVALIERYFERSLMSVMVCKGPHGGNRRYCMSQKEHMNRVNNFDCPFSDAMYKYVQSFPNLKGADCPLHPSSGMFSEYPIAPRHAMPCS